MKIGFFSPYLPKHAGGGEKHALTTAWYLAQRHEVTMLVPEVSAELPVLIQRYEKLFNLDLSRVHWKSSLLAQRQSNVLQTWLETRHYDAFFFFTDGSFFFPGSKRSILHVQIPFTNTLSTWQRKKLAAWTVLNTNSDFTKQVIQKNWQRAVDIIHYPFVNTADIAYPSPKKERKILAVGRFYDPQHTDVHAKRQDLLVDAFVQACQQRDWHKEGWELHLVGSVEPGGVHSDFVHQLQKQADGYPVFFHHDISHAELEEYYRRSMVFWHAAGFGINEEKYPQKVEHFGMSVIEAMAHGTIPVVTNKGGLKETVVDTQNGFLFSTLEELLTNTEKIMNASTKEKAAWQDAAHNRAQQFSLQRFCDTIDTMLTMKN